MAQTPDVDFDERSRSGYVLVRMKIPRIKPGPSGLLKKPTKAMDGNAELQGPSHNDNRSVSLTIKDKGGLDSDYVYSVQKLPYPIDTAGTKVEVQNGWVLMYLKKVDPNRSWESVFRDGTLETN